MTTVSVHEAKTHLSRLIERVPLVSNEKLFDGFGVERIW
jgi:hypothetical protein